MTRSMSRICQIQYAKLHSWTGREDRRYPHQGRIVRPQIGGSNGRSGAAGLSEREEGVGLEHLAGAVEAMYPAEETQFGVAQRPRRGAAESADIAGDRHRRAARRAPRCELARRR